MSAPSPVSPPEAPKSKVIPWSTLISRLVRLSLIGVVLYLGWHTFQGYREMLSGPRPLKEEEIDLDQAALLAPLELLMDQPDLGPWLLAGLPFQMEPRDIDQKKVEENLLAPFKAADPEKAWPVDAALRRVLQFLERRPGGKEEESIYRLNMLDQRVVVFTRREGEKEWILGGRLARKKVGGGTWTFIEVTAGSGLAAEPVSSQFLLPLPPGGRVLAQRQTTAGATLAQFTLLNVPVAQAQVFWKEQGWEVRKVKGLERGNLLVCRKAGVTISAWSLSGTAEDSGALLLVRLPETPAGAVRKKGS